METAVDDLIKTLLRSRGATKIEKKNDYNSGVSPLIFLVARAFPLKFCREREKLELEMGKKVVVVVVVVVVVFPGGAVVRHELGSCF